jgi:hydrocephalus-inducing protein
LKGVNGVSVRP